MHFERHRGGGVHLTDAGRAARLDPASGPVGATHASPAPTAARTMPNARRQSPRIAARTMPGCVTPIATHRRPHIARGPGPVGATHASPGGLSPPAQCPDARRQSPRMPPAHRPWPRPVGATHASPGGLSPPAQCPDARRQSPRIAARTSPVAPTGRGDACVARAYHRPHNARMRDANRHASPPAHRRCPGPVGATHASPVPITARTMPGCAPIATHRRPHIARGPDR